MSNVKLEAEEMARRAHTIHASGANCAEAVWQAFASELELNETETNLGNRLAGGFGGGLGVGDLCGAVAGAIIALGYVGGRRPDQPRDDSYRAGCQQLCLDFEKEFGALHCRVLKQPDNKEFCGELVAGAARLLWEQVGSVPGNK